MSLDATVGTVWLLLAMQDRPVAQALLRLYAIACAVLRSRAKCIRWAQSRCALTPARSAIINHSDRGRFALSFGGVADGLQGI